MAKSNELTNVKALEMAIELAKDNKELAEKLGKIKASYENRKSSGKTEAQLKADAEYLEEVYNAVTNEPQKASEIAKALDTTSQKVTPRLGKLVEAGRIKVEKVKGANVYTLAVAEG